MLFFITGVSAGLGRAAAEAALADGHIVVGTLRHADQIAAFEALAPGRAYGRLLDVTDEGAIVRVVDGVESDIGAIDVLINNAGYGHEGTVEESPISELRRQFDVNLFGAVGVIKAVLPYMRGRRAGRILNISSMGGIMTLPGLAYYHGSKFALEGISESLGKEVKGFGIHVTAVEPGSFRTEWAGRSLNRQERTIADYDEIFGPIRERRRNYSGNQPGDPAKAARAMLEIVKVDEPPAHLLLGRDAVQLVREKLGQLCAEINEWERLSLSTDFD